MKLPAEYLLDVSTVWLKHVKSSAIMFYFQVLDGNQEHWQQPIMLGGGELSYGNSLTNDFKRGDTFLSLGFPFVGLWYLEGALSPQYSVTQFIPS